MKAKFLILTTIMVLVSCGGGSEVAEEIEKELTTGQKASLAMKTLLNELFAGDTLAYNITAEEEMFSNDSLCIIHIDYLDKSQQEGEQTNKREYIYLISDSTAYEVMLKEGEKVYFSNTDYDLQRLEEIKNRALKASSELEYPLALYYFASLKINLKGRAVGSEDLDSEIHVPSLIGVGKWDLRKLTDEFGDETEEKCLAMYGHGVFSNSATTNSPMTAKIVITKNDFWILLFKYDVPPAVRGGYISTFKIKDGEGEVHEWWGMQFKRDIICPYYKESLRYDELQQILSKEGSVTIYISEEYGATTYKFTMDFSGYNEAVKYFE